MAVYFIQAGRRGPIKIGYADKPAIRLNKIRADNHRPVAILATIEGGEAIEADFHARFAADRIRGEWFRPTPNLLAVIATLPRPRLIEAEPKTPFDHFVKKFGNQARAAKALGMSRGALSKWKGREQIPPLRAVQIERLTKGMVTRESLRPDLYLADCQDGQKAA